MWTGGVVWGFREWTGRHIRALTRTLLLLLVFVQPDGGRSMSGPPPAAAPELGPDKEAGGPAAEVCMRWGLCGLLLSSPVCDSTCLSLPIWVGEALAPPQESDTHSR